MTLSEIRQAFFDFFESKGHQIVPSAPMVIKNDPTLMFTNAGMNQFKDFFLGNAVPKHRRVADTQKCLRVSGKHNDLEEVGVDTYHHTMFEMLGNWSFGDYFKEEAIEWAWTLLTEVYKLPKERLYVTVFEGDEKDGVPKDTESYNIWKKYIAEDQIILASKKDNFWEMGETGPCGPCTEIHIDLRSPERLEEKAGKDLVNQDDPQVVEIWNNVFMQFNRKADGSLEKLPETHVDTGMGLERLAMAMQGKQSNYDIDLFQTLIAKVEKLSGAEYRKTEEINIAMRVIADHIRAIAFSISDGQLPSNTGAGYVIRRILRRAVRYGYQVLDMKEPFMCELSTTLAEIMGNPFQELIQQKELIYKVIKEEENSFFKTLEQGIRRMDVVMEQTKNENKNIIDGKVAFELFDTYGFPIDLTSLIARENNLKVDESQFLKSLQEQKDRSRNATAVSVEDWEVLIDDNAEEFVGYDHLSTQIKIVKYRKVSQKQKEFYQLVFNLTPFYAEGGGQVGDNGTIESDNETIQIFDTKKENNLIVHLSEKLPNDLKATFTAKVNVQKRNLTCNNHSATHLLHHALREVLGTHVEQKGSLVNEKYLRFDFSHFSKVTDEELQKIESLVIQNIKEAIVLEEKRNTPIEEAQAMGAMALFGEKYGDTVRVVKFGKSVELCGGTHVQNTNSIGLFKILSEGAVAAGVRRIEAITSDAVETFYKEKSDILQNVALTLKNPKDILKTVEDLLSKNSEMQKQIAQFEKEAAKMLKYDLQHKIQKLDNFSLLAEIVETDAGSIKDILFQLKGENDNFIGILCGDQNDKCSVSILISDELINDQRNAGQIIKEVSKFIQGGGGGQANFATAGGKNSKGLKEALDLAKEKIMS